MSLEINERQLYKVKAQTDKLEKACEEKKQQRNALESRRFDLLLCNKRTRYV